MGQYCHHQQPQSVQFDYGTDGTQVVDMTATDWGNGPDSTKAVQFWRDPIVTATSPADGAVDVALDTAVSVTFSNPMEPTTTFDVVDADSNVVTGAFAYDDIAQTVTFVPNAPLAPATTYDVTIAGAVSVGQPGGDSGVLQTPVVFSFTTRALTPTEQFAALRAEVQSLVASGDLSAKYGKMLLVMFNKAEITYNLGYTRVTIRVLHLIDHYIDLLIWRGELTIEQAQPLHDGIDTLIVQLRGW